jgi:prepilin-type N-terminal cleavage/methylation domain-containing protein
MRRGGFTLIELIFTLVVVGIVASITTDVVRLLYERYALSREIARADSELRRALDLIGNRLSYGVRQSMIGRNLNTGAITPIDHPDLDDDYEMLEWIATAYESRLGMAATTGAPLQTGWSGFFIRTGADALISPESHFEDAAEPIEVSLTGNGDPFGNNHTILIFDRSDLNASHFNWLDDNRSAYYSIAPTSEESLTFTHYEGDPDQTLPTAHYYLARTAQAVWVEDGDLMLAYDYRPWREEDYLDGKRSKVASDISAFNFRARGGIVQLVLCRRVDAFGEAESEQAEFCKERVVFQ